MRLNITNSSPAQDTHILPLIRFAAKFFTIPGKVHVNFRQKRNGELWGGYCRRTREPRISVRSTLNASHPQLPCKVEHLLYFQACRIPITPYEVRTPEEIIVHVAAHEFAHLMQRGEVFRKSRIEVFCENRATEILDAFRSPEGQAWITADRESMGAEPVTEEAALSAKVAAREGKIANGEAKLKRWQSKAKRAATAIKKLELQLKRLRAL